MAPHLTFLITKQSYKVLQGCGCPHFADADNEAHGEEPICSRAAWPRSACFPLYSPCSTPRRERLLMTKHKYVDKSRCPASQCARHPRPPQTVVLSYQPGERSRADREKMLHQSSRAIAGAHAPHSIHRLKVSLALSRGVLVFLIIGRNPLSDSHGSMAGRTGNKKCLRE